MTGTPNHSLIVTRKQETEKDPKVLPASFRQVENWANGGKWQNLTFISPFSQFIATPQRPCQFFADPFGFVHVRGILLYTGTPTADTFINAMSFPSSYAPTLSDTGGIPPGTGEVASQWRIQANANIIQLAFLTSITNPVTLLGGGGIVMWAPFN